MRGQFACRGEHQCADAHAAKFVGCRLGSGQALQDGQGKGSGFAGAGLGAAQEVVAGQDQGNRLCLDGGGRFVALLAHGFKDGGRQIQFIEVHTEAPEGAYIPAGPHGR